MQMDRRISFVFNHSASRLLPPPRRRAASRQVKEGIFFDVPFLNAAAAFPAGPPSRCIIISRISIKRIDMCYKARLGASLAAHAAPEDRMRIGR